MKSIDGGKKMGWLLVEKMMKGFRIGFCSNGLDFELSVVGVERLILNMNLLVVLM